MKVMIEYYYKYTPFKKQDHFRIYEVREFKDANWYQGIVAIIYREMARKGHKLISMRRMDEENQI
jgi:hypothetical protein